MTDATPLLELRGVRAAYDRIDVLFGVDLVVGQGSVVALLGPNGAGKTTLLKVACGLMPATAGDVLYAGRRVNGVRPDELARRGVTMVPEGRGVFPNLTVRENLRMMTYTGATLAEVEEIAFTRFPRLKERARQVAGTMSGGEQQMLAMGRALMARPKVLLLDEPSMGLAPRLVAKIFEIVQEISRQGVTILLVEQNALLALEISQRGYVMESGAITLSDDARALRADPKIREAYLGEGA